MHFELHYEHDWDVTPAEAIAIQKDLAGQVREEPLDQPVETVAGVDVSVRGDRVQAAIAVLTFPKLEVVDRAVWRGPVAFPYVPGLLSFREMPAILPALEKLSVTPDLFMTDSQGRAHMRRFGLACHLGVLLDWPTIGVAKSRLTGHHDDPPPKKGGRVPLVDDGERIGTVLRTRTEINPVYVSVGHRITLHEAEQIALDCAPRYKIPEPTRAAHKLSRDEEA